MPLSTTLRSLAGAATGRNAGGATMLVRRNVVSLSAPDRAALVAAIKAMKTRPDPDGVASNLYDKYVLRHSLTMQTASPPNTNPLVCNMAHRGPAFCPWH